MTATIHTDECPDVQEMVVVHRAFRRESAVAAGYVRSTREGDTRRSRLVADHLRLCMAGLEMHHTGEDVVLWPLLLQRAAPSTGLVETMQAQHGAIDTHSEAIVHALASWEGNPSQAASEQLAQLLERLNVALIEHLDLEEREILPLASRYVTAAEWNQMGEHGKDSMSLRQLPVMFGLVLEDADDAERTRMLGNLPLPVRFLLRTVGVWQFKRYVKRLRGS